MDERNYRNDGGQLHLTKTLAKAMIADKQVGSWVNVSYGY
jgi:hypothetical protein